MFEKRGLCVNVAQKIRKIDVSLANYLSNDDN
jgi:hypothetical protein